MRRPRGGDRRGPARTGVRLRAACVAVVGLTLSACSPITPTATPFLPAPVTSGPSQPASGAPGPSSTSPSGPSAAPAGNGPIVLDPGQVPEWLRDRYVSLNGVVGQLGSDVSVRLPADENVLGFGRDTIVTTAADPDTHEPIWRDSGLHVTVRELTTLNELASFDTKVFITESVVVGSQLIWIGLTGEPGATDIDPIDAGIYALNLDDPKSEPELLQEPRNLVDDFGDLASRGLLRAVNGGAAVSTVIQGEKRLVTEVFDLKTRETITIETGTEVALAVANGRALLVVPHEYATTTQVIRLVDFPSLAERSKPIDVDLAENSVVYGAQEMFVLVAIDGRQRILGIRLEDGKPRTVLEFDAAAGESFDLDAYLSTEAFLALTPASGPEEDDQGRLLTPVSLLDTTEGKLIRDAFTLAVVP